MQRVCGGRGRSLSHARRIRSWPTATVLTSCVPSTALSALAEIEIDGTARRVLFDTVRRGTGWSATSIARLVAGHV
jgi:hypothetical protein